EVREQLGIRGMDKQEARNFREKSLMKQVLEEHGLPCARHVLAGSAEEARKFAAEVGFPLVVKPPAGAGARNTFRVDNMNDFAGYLASAPPRPSASVMVEEFMTGDEFSFDTVTLHRKHVFHSISRYSPGPLEVMETPWIQWTVLLPRSIEGPEYAAITAAGTK